MKKFLSFLIACLAILVIGCSSAPADDEAMEDDTMMEDDAMMEEESMDDIDAAIESGDPEACEALGEPFMVEACLQEQGN